MAKKSAADTSAKLFKLLEPLSSEERIRVVRGTLTLLGEDNVSDVGGRGESDGGGQSLVRGGKAQGARGFFEQKDPKTKIEELAIAARYRETTANARTHTRQALEKVFGEARRNFDSRYFARDLDNARTAGFFNKGGSATAGYTLSYHGQNYVDALPDREAAKLLRKPKRSSGRGKKRANAAKG